MEPSGRQRVPDSEKMDMPHVVDGTARRVIWVTNACVYTETQEGDLHLLLDKVAKECRPVGHSGQIIRQMSLTQSQQSSGATEKAISTMRGLARTYLAVLKENNTCLST